jgi:hypothetical protein
MNNKQQINFDVYDSPGSRFSHILDKAGFKRGRGRVIDLQHYLIETCPKYFHGLKYTTVRAWFQHHAPPMQKMDAIMDALQLSYQFSHDISHIKTWWKAGGYYPFSETDSDATSPFYELQDKIAAVKEKLPFIIMSIVTDEAGEHFGSLTGSELAEISDKAMIFAEEFLDPFNITCPDELLRHIVRQELLKALEKSIK